MRDVTQDNQLVINEMKLNDLGDIDLIYVHSKGKVTKIALAVK